MPIISYSFSAVQTSCGVNAVLNNYRSKNLRSTQPHEPEFGSEILLNINNGRVTVIRDRFPYDRKEVKTEKVQLRWKHLSNCGTEICDLLRLVEIHGKYASISCADRQRPHETCDRLLSIFIL